MDSNDSNSDIFTGLLFYAYVEIHQVRGLVFDNYQKCTFPLKKGQHKHEPYGFVTQVNFYR